MKTNYPLLAKISAHRNLNEAWLRVHAKKSSGGLDKVTVMDFAERLEKNLDTLGRELLEQRYVPEPLAAIKIPKKPDSRETRELGLPSVRDKIAQEAVRRVIGPVLEKNFLDCSYGYRQGKGPQRAIGRVNHHLCYLGCTWVVSADIDNFFGTLNHDLLLKRLSQVIADEAVVRLLELWLKMGRVDGAGRWHDVYSGVSQGGVISPLLANFYLHPLDKYLRDRDYGLVRYSDDFVILCTDRRQADKAYRETVSFLKNDLGLLLNKNINPVQPVEDGFTFLGIRCQPDSLTIADEKLDRIRRKLADTIKLSGNRSFEDIIRQTNESAAGWKRYYGKLVKPQEFRRIEDMIISRLGNLTAQALKKGIFRKNSEAEKALDSLMLPGRSDPKARRRLIKKILKLARQAMAVGRQEKKSVGRSTAAVVRGRKSKELKLRVPASDLNLSAPGSFLGKTGQRIVVRRNRRIVCETAAANLRTITISGRGVSLSAEVVRYCAGQNIPLLFTGPAGQVEAMLSAPASINAAVQLRQLQAHMDPAERFRLARRVAMGKIKNQRNLTKYLGKYHCRKNNGFKSCLTIFLDQWDSLHRELQKLTCEGGPAKFRNRIMAVEGRCASLYWDVVQALLDDKVDFPGRRRRGATDLTNSMLNYGYAILQGRVYQAILKSGLNPQISFLHEPHRNKPTLSFDLMEEFRSQVVDRPVTSLLNRSTDMKLDREGLLTTEARNRLIKKVFERLASIIQFRGRELTLDEIIVFQARHFAHCLKEGNRYRPFIGKW